MNDTEFADAAIEALDRAKRVLCRAEPSDGAVLGVVDYLSQEDGLLKQCVCCLLEDCKTAPWQERVRTQIATSGLPFDDGARCVATVCRNKWGPRLQTITLSGGEACAVRDRLANNTTVLIANSHAELYSEPQYVHYRRIIELLQQWNEVLCRLGHNSGVTGI